MRYDALNDSNKVAEELRDDGYNGKKTLVSYHMTPEGIYGRAAGVGCWRENDRCYLERKGGKR